MKLTHHLSLLSVLLATCGVAADPPRLPELEQVVVDRLVERQVPGEMVYISAEGKPFIGLYLEAPDVMPQGAVILVHGFGGHPDWPDVIAPLRRRLPLEGWATLSIQMPRLSAEASHDLEEELPRRGGSRLAAAITWLSQRQRAPVAVIGYGFGAAVAARQLAISTRGVSGFIAISLQVPAHLEKATGFPESLGAIRVPVLDVFAEKDSELVLAGMPLRELWGRKGKDRPFDRIVLAGAAEGFHGREDELAGHIERWLVANACCGVGVTPAR